MLQRLLEAIPNIIGAAIVLGLGYIIARWVGGLLDELLPGLGVDRSVEALGAMPEGAKVSDIIGKIAMVAIMLVSAIAATRLLNFPELTNLVNQVLSLGGSVIFGGVIVAAGFLVANVLGKLVGRAGAPGLG